MGVAVQAQSEVPLVGVQVPRIHSELLDLYCLQQQQLFQSIINRLLLEQQLEFVLQMAEVVRLELDAKLRNVVVEVGEVGVQGLGVVDEQGVHSEVIYQFLRHLAVGQDHELLHQFLGVYALLEADVDGHVGLVQLEHYFIFVKDLAVASKLPPIEGDRPQDHQLLLQPSELFLRQLLLLLKFCLISFGVHNSLGFLVGQLRATLHHSLLEPRGQHIALKINLEEGAKGQSPLLGLEGKLCDQLRRHHVDGLMGQIDRGALVGDFLSVDEVLIRGHIRNMHSQLVDSLSQDFKRKAVLHVGRVGRVDREDHRVELAMILDRQVILFTRQVLRIQQSALLLRDLQSMHEDFSLNLWCFVFPTEDGEDAALGTILLIVPIQESAPEVGLLVSFYHLLQGKVLVCNLGRVYHIEGGQSFVDRQGLDPVPVAFGLHLECAQYIFSLAKVLAMLDAHHNSIDYLPISLALGQVLPPHLGPVDLRTVKDLEAVGIIYLNPLRHVGTLNDGRIISMSGLDQVDTLVEVVILLHDLPYIFILTQRKSQINLSWVKLKYEGVDLERRRRERKWRGWRGGWQGEGMNGNGFEGKMEVLRFQLSERV